jgi:LacI family transcriptional regulator
LSGQRRQTPTIHDVARHAGVSSMTASRVVNDYPHVSAPVRERVNAAIQTLGYRPNTQARATRTGISQIGLLYSNPNSSNLSNFLMGAFKEASASGSQLLIEPTPAHPTPLTAVRKLVEAGVRAIVLPPPLCDDPEVFAFLERERVPSVSFATATPRPDKAAVFVDDYAGARMMTRHLIDLGHVDIAFIRGDPKHSTARRREEGFRETMAAAGLAVPDARIADGDFTYRSGLDAARQLLTTGKRPTAIFAANDDMAAAVSAVAHGLGLDVPSELSIGGFDDTPVASTVWPELTTIRQPIAEMAATAVSMAAALIRQDGEDERRHVNAGLTLVPRASTAAPGAARS